MQVQMFLKAGAASTAEIESHIESLGFHHFYKQSLGVEREMPEIQSLPIGQILHPACPAVWHDHEVTRCIRVFIENKKGVFSTGHHKVGGVILRISSLG
jgi:hypothetical protein